MKVCFEDAKVRNVQKRITKYIRLRMVHVDTDGIENITESKSCNQRLEVWSVKRGTGFRDTTT